MTEHLKYCLEAVISKRRLPVVFLDYPIKTEQTTNKIKQNTAKETDKDCMKKCVYMLNKLNTCLCRKEYVRFCR